jgi:hypothetical protein
MRLEEDDLDREPFTLTELHTLFTAPVFTKGDRPSGGRGEAAFWLPALGLFTGAGRLLFRAHAYGNCGQTPGYPKGDCRWNDGQH